MPELEAGWPPQGRRRGGGDACRVGGDKFEWIARLVIRRPYSGLSESLNIVLVGDSINKDLSRRHLVFISMSVPQANMHLYP